MNSTQSRDSKIENVVRDILGSDRVRSVETRSVVNDDGGRILRIRVVYDAERGVTVTEMDKIQDATWPEADSEQEAIPVFDFQEDTDHGFLAAE